MSADPRYDVRGPDEFEERELQGTIFGHRVRISEPRYPVIAAGVCPACGELDCGAAKPPARGYRCEA